MGGVERRHLTSLALAVIPVRLVTDEEEEGGESKTAVDALAAEVVVVAVAAGVEASVAVAAEAAVAIAVAVATDAVAGVGVGVEAAATAEGVVQRGHGIQRHAGSVIAVTVESTTIPVAAAAAGATAEAVTEAVTEGPQEETVVAVQGAEVLTGVEAGAVVFAEVTVTVTVLESARVVAAIGAAV